MDALIKSLAKLKRDLARIGEFESKKDRLMLIEFAQRQLDELKSQLESE